MNLNTFYESYRIQKESLYIPHLNKRQTGAADGMAAAPAEDISTPGIGGSEVMSEAKVAIRRQAVPGTLRQQSRNRRRSEGRVCWHALTSEEEEKPKGVKGRKGQGVRGSVLLPRIDRAEFLRGAAACRRGARGRETVVISKNGYIFATEGEIVYEFAPFYLLKPS